MNFCSGTLFLLSAKTFNTYFNALHSLTGRNEFKSKGFDAKDNCWFVISKALCVNIFYFFISMVKILSMFIVFILYRDYLVIM